MQTLVKDSTNVVRLAKLRDAVTLAFLANATVTCTLNDNAGSPVAPATTNLPMNYAASPRAGAPGEYRATIPANIALVVGDQYELVVTAVASDGSTRIFNEPCVAALG